MRTLFLSISLLALVCMVPGLYVGAMLMVKFGSFYAFPLPCFVLLAVACYSMCKAEGMPA